jgi:hypothetical protein
MATSGAAGRRFRAPNLGGRQALAIIPAYNEAEAIERVLRDLRRHAPWADALVVSDGSRDGTADRARRAGATVLELRVNLGIGGAVQAGYRYALRQGYDLAFQFDGDGQHRASRLADIAAPILDGTADVVTGSRLLEPRGRTSRPERLLGIRILAAAVSAAAGQRVTDPTSGFRAAGPRAIALFAREFAQDYPEPEAIVLAVRHGLRFREVPTTIRRRRAGRSSIRLLDGIHYMTKVLLAVIMGLFKGPVRLEEEVA